MEIKMKKESSKNERDLKKYLKMTGRGNRSRNSLTEASVCIPGRTRERERGRCTVREENEGKRKKELLAFQNPRMGTCTELKRAMKV